MANARLTVGQALVRFLLAQHSERDGASQRFFAGCWGIFGQCNMPGLGAALVEASDDLRYYSGRSEQGTVHAAAGYARMKNRLQAFVCTSSIGTGAANMATGAALATVNRLPVLLIPGDAPRAASPVNDCLRPVSRYFDRIWRPEQLPAVLLQAMRVLTDPAETGAVTIALPRDIAAETFDWPGQLFETRTWRIPRTRPEPRVLADAGTAIRASRRPLLVAGGGVLYSEASAALRHFVEATGIPVAETQAGKGALPFDHPSAVGAIGVTGTTAANSLAGAADLIIGVGTRCSDFAAASNSLFAPEAGWVNLNVAGFDACSRSAVPLVADARAGLEELTQLLAGWQVDPAYRLFALGLAAAWDGEVERAYHLGNRPLPAQSEVIGAVNQVSAPRDVVVCAAGSMPGDLHKLWRTRDCKGYHVENGYSCMGYEIAGGLGVKLAAPDREVFVLVGASSYLALSSELVTAIADDIKLVIILVQNCGFQPIEARSQSAGTVDLAANAASLGADVIAVTSIAELRDALAAARSATRTTVIHIETDPTIVSPPGESTAPPGGLTSLPG
jgi:3D-(3,5/4)-trihydroxycyclohexane-1,2-dione acylhydrolase (decyclizing)